MPITYSIEHSREVIMETWAGEISADDLAAHWRAYLADPDVLRIRRTLVDLRRSKILFYGHEMDDLIRTIVVPILGDLDWKTAVLVDDHLQFGISRQYQAFAERYSKDAIFKDSDTAIQWLVAAK